MKKVMIMIALAAFISGCACPFGGCGSCGCGKKTECSTKKCCGTCKSDKTKCTATEKAKCGCATTGKCCGTCK